MATLRKATIRFLMATGWGLALTLFHLGMYLTPKEAAWFTGVVAGAIVVGTLIGAYVRGFIDAWLLISFIPLGLGLAGGYGAFYLLQPHLPYIADTSLIPNFLT